jgi:hypothetical protein
MKIEARGATFTGKTTEFEVPGAAFKALARWLTDGRIIVYVMQRAAGIGAWCGLGMEEWNGEKLAVWGVKTALDDVFPVGPENVPLNRVVIELNAGIKTAIEANKE